ncbi:MAG: proton-conducting membrane transporter [Clostridia bacterium]|nr:proton-conducting membrane transporter [Clostridia bacterium]
MSEIFLLLPIGLALLAGMASYLIPFPSNRVRHTFLVVSTFAVSISVWCLLLWRPTGVLEIYQFTEELNISLKLDGLGCFFAGMTSFLWPFAVLYGVEYMRHEGHTRMFFLFYLFTFGVTEGICFSGNMLTIFVFYEMLTLVTLPLVLSKFNEDSQYVARKYAMYCLGGSAFAFIGVVFLSVYGGGAPFVMGGVLENADISKTTMLILYVVTFFGFGVKAAVFPFHAWLPMASVAPTPVTALLHAVAVVKSGVFLIIRLTYFSYGTEYLYGSWAQKVVLAFAIFTCLYGAVMAVRERHFKRRLAYSTVSNLSYILFGVLLMTSTGLFAGLSHMLFHAIIKIGAFMCAGAFMHMTGREYIFELDGVGRRMPKTFAFFGIFSLALVGIPLFNGFVSKYWLIMAGFEEGSLLGIIGVVGLILAAFLCAMYMFTILVRAFFPRRGQDKFLTSNVTDPTWHMLVPMGVFAILCVVLGLWPQPVIGLLESISLGLF